MKAGAGVRATIGDALRFAGNWAAPAPLQAVGGQVGGLLHPESTPAQSFQSLNDQILSFSEAAGPRDAYPASLSRSQTVRVGGGGDTLETLLEVALGALNVRPLVSFEKRMLRCRENFLSVDDQSKQRARLELPRPKFARNTTSPENGSIEHESEPIPPTQRHRGGCCLLEQRVEISLRVLRSAVNCVPPRYIRLWSRNSASEESISASPVSGERGIGRDRVTASASQSGLSLRVFRSSDVWERRSFPGRRADRGRISNLDLAKGHAVHLDGGGVGGSLTGGSGRVGSRVSRAKVRFSKQLQVASE